MRPIRTLILACLGIAGCGGASAVPKAVEVGQPAPIFRTVDVRGDSVSTRDLAGTVVLLNVWATWCAPCRVELPYLVRLHEEEHAKGLSIIGVSVDAEGENDKISAFANEYRMTYPIWRDPEQRVLTEFQAIGVPASYLIDRRGVLRWKHVGIIRETDATFRAALDAALGDSP